MKKEGGIVERLIKINKKEFILNFAVTKALVCGFMRAISRKYRKDDLIMPGKVAGRVGSTGSARPTPRNMRRDKERCERENRAAQERREKAASEAKRRRDERMTQEQINHDTYVHRAARAEATAEIAGFPRGRDPKGIGEKIYERELARQGGIEIYQLSKTPKNCAKKLMNRKNFY